MKENTDIKVEVKKEDLKGNYFDRTDCPIARALKRQFPNFQIHVGKRVVVVNHKMYHLPRRIDIKSHNRSILYKKGGIIKMLAFGFSFTLKPHY